MEDVIFWIGALHLAAYALAGLVLAASLFIEWLIKRLGIKREMLRAYQRVLEDRERTPATPNQETDHG